jgi:hypothetical protein
LTVVGDDVLPMGDCLLPEYRFASRVSFILSANLAAAEIACCLMAKPAVDVLSFAARR